MTSGRWNVVNHYLYLHSKIFFLKPAQISNFNKFAFRASALPKQLSLFHSYVFVPAYNLEL